MLKLGDYTQEDIARVTSLASFFVSEEERLQMLRKGEENDGVLTGAVARLKRKDGAVIEVLFSFVPINSFKFSFNIQAQLPLGNTTICNDRRTTWSQWQRRFHQLLGCN